MVFAAFKPLSPIPTFLSAGAPPDISSASDAELGGRIYTALASDATIRTGLGLDTEHSIFIKNTIIPRVLEARRRLLGSSDDRPNHTRAISSKDPLLQFGSYGKANMRVKNGQTYIALPHIKPLHGSIKIVKYMIAISQDGSRIPLKMMSKIKKPFRTKERCKKFINTATILQSFKHPNILVPTDILIPSNKKGYELINDKCETDLFNFLQKPLKTTTPIASQVKDCIRYMQEITSAMKYVYDRGYLHCDLKSENILMQRDPDGNLKTMLTDFDMLAKYDDSSQILRGAIPYVPPSYLELDSGKKNDISSEFYALGKTLHADPEQLVSFTMLLSKLENLAKSAGNEPLSKAILKLTADITSLSERLTQDKISDYTTVLKELDKIALRFDKDLTAA